MLFRSRVATTVVDRDAKVQHLRAALGSPQLGISGQVARNVHSVDAHDAHYLSLAQCLALEIRCPAIALGA